MAFSRLGALKTGWLIRNVAIQHKLGRVRVGCRLDLEDPERHPPLHLRNPLLNNIVNRELQVYPALQIFFENSYVISARAMCTEPHSFLQNSFVLTSVTRRRIAQASSLLSLA